MTEKVSKIAKQDVRIEYLKEGQYETERDIRHIKESINNLDKGLTVFQNSVESMEKNYKEFINEEKARADLITEIYAELQEIRATQEVMYSEMNTKDERHDKDIEQLKTDVEECRKEIKIETQRQRDALKEYVDRTKFDWFEMVNSGVKNILGKVVELMFLGGTVYIIMRVKESSE